MTPSAVWFLVLLVVLGWTAAWLFWTQFIGAGWTPTPGKVVNRMLEFADLKDGDILYDLGCGDGRIAIRAAKKYGVRAVGIEVDIFRVGLSRLMVRLNGVGDKVKIVQKNLFNVDLSEASVVTVFLTQKSNHRLKAKLLALPPGTRVVTHIWTFDGWEPTLADKKLKAFLYVVK